MKAKKKIVTENGAVILTSPEDLRAARYDQPRVSLEELKANEAEHRAAAEKSGKVAKKEILKSGRATTVRG